MSEFLDVIQESDLLKKEEFKKLNQIKESLLKTYNTVQMFRTRTEMEVSILNDMKFPTSDSKYWQQIREQNVMFTELVNLSFEYRKNKIEMQRLLEDIDIETNRYDKELLKIDLESRQFRERDMERVQKDRLREIFEWEDIKNKLFPLLQCGDENVNDHQLVSYTKRWINELIQQGDSGSPSERGNLYSQLEQGVQQINRLGLLNELLKDYNQGIKDFINNVVLKGTGR